MTCDPHAPSDLAPRCFQICPVLSHGFDGGAASTRYLDYPLFCELADNLEEIDELQLRGNADPLLHLHLFDMVRHAASRGIRVSITSRLTVLPVYRAEQCVTSGLYAMYVALDAPTAALYRKMCGRDCFAKVLRNLRRLTAARQRLAASLPLIYLACAVTRRNLAYLPDLVQMAHDEKLDGMRIETSDADKDAGRITAVAARHIPRQTGTDRQLLREDAERAAFYFARARTRAGSLNFPLMLAAPYAGTFASSQSSSV